MNNTKKKIGIVGAGNVASHLARTLNQAGNNIAQVVSRSIESAESLGAEFNAVCGTDISILLPDIDILVLAVPDHVIPDIVGKLKYFNGVVVHTSGSVPIDVFNNLDCPNGIFYPLQTFSKGRDVDFKNIPVFVEAGDEKTLSILLELAKGISVSVHELNSENRAHLHLAAVFVNNFTNYMMSAAKDVLDLKGISVDVINSLVKETFEKSFEMGPDSSQTGPAIRGDKPTIKKHLKLLSFSPELSKVYQCLTDSIQSRYNKESENKQD